MRIQSDNDSISQLLSFHWKLISRLYQFFPFKKKRTRFPIFILGFNWLECVCDSVQTPTKLLNVNNPLMKLEGELISFTSFFPPSHLLAKKNVIVFVNSIMCDSICFFKRVTFSIILSSYGKNYVIMWISGMILCNVDENLFAWHPFSFSPAHGKS